MVLRLGTYLDVVALEERKVLALGGAYLPRLPTLLRDSR